mmetsp:Transcript_41997/g.120061  ORF Transcript_41997/g.120061 Transcript_41997/m.120061 type:complete len:505 (-) Transcript_41997:639-2153(-)
MPAPAAQRRPGVRHRRRATGTDLRMAPTLSWPARLRVRRLQRRCCHSSSRRQKGPRRRQAAAALRPASVQVPLAARPKLGSSAVALQVLDRAHSQQRPPLVCLAYLRRALEPALSADQQQVGSSVSVRAPEPALSEAAQALGPAPSAPGQWQFGIPMPYSAAALQVREAQALEPVLLGEQPLEPVPSAALPQVVCSAAGLGAVAALRARVGQPLVAFWVPPPAQVRSVVQHRAACSEAALQALEPACLEGLHKAVCSQAVAQALGPAAVALQQAACSEAAQRARVLHRVLSGVRQRVVSSRALRQVRAPPRRRAPSGVPPWVAPLEAVQRLLDQASSEVAVSSVAPPRARDPAPLEAPPPAASSAAGAQTLGSDPPQTAKASARHRPRLSALRPRPRALAVRRLPRIAEAVLEEVRWARAGESPVSLVAAVLAAAAACSVEVRSARCPWRRRHRQRPPRRPLRRRPRWRPVRRSRRRRRRRPPPMWARRVPRQQPRNRAALQVL